MSPPWRFMPSVTVAGATHMAIDNWLLNQLITHQQPPTLRFYRWSTATLSLGYHQKQWPQHWRQLTWRHQPLALVRRPTGGRAVLHQGDLTYAIALPLTGRRQDAYRQICDALVTAWRQLGVALHYGTAGRSYRDQDSCFALSTPADLVTASGYKLIGSAQLRRDRYLLQHGSIRLWPDRQLYQQVFHPTAAPYALAPATLPPQPDDQFVNHLEQLIQQALAQTFDVEFATSPLSRAEQTLIAAQSEQFAIPADSLPEQVASTRGDIRRHL